MLRIKITITMILLLLAGLLVYDAAAAPDNAVRPVHVVNLEGTITAGKNTFLQRQVEAAEENNAQLLVVVMNTPGGLVDATLQINELFLNAELPVAVLVAPSGAIAGSAGAFIIISSDLAAMAPGTTVGAAQPITFTPEGADAADEKTTTFYASHLRSMAREKGRPEDIAERFVTENLTLNSREAYELGVIEYIAGSVEELLEMVDGLELEKQGRLHQLQTTGASLVSGEMTTRERLQNWISDPQIAYLVLMLGILGIYFGLGAPGTIVPEVTGAILLILGIYGIGLFDTNTTGIVLLLLGAGLLIAEFFTAGFGILGIGGAASLVVGAVLLPMEPLMARDWYTAFLVTVVGTVLGLVIILLFVVQRVVDSRRRWRGGSAYFNPPEQGIVVSEINPEGMIKARGELWRARSIDGSVIAPGTEIEVVRAETLLLWVQARSGSENHSSD